MKCFGPCSISVQRIPCRRRAGLVRIQSNTCVKPHLPTSVYFSLTIFYFIVFLFIIIIIIVIVIIIIIYFYLFF